MSRRRLPLGPSQIDAQISRRFSISETVRSTDVLRRPRIPTKLADPARQTPQTTPDIPRTVIQTRPRHQLSRLVRPLLYGRVITRPRTPPPRLPRPPNPGGPRGPVP